MPLSQLEIAGLKDNTWLSNENISTYDSFVPSYEPVMAYLKKLPDYKVIEIGPGKKPVIKDWPCKEYIGVQPFPFEIDTGIDNATFVQEDGLTFLRKQEDSSAVVISFGVLDDAVLGFFRLPLQEQYKQELAGEIRRVSYPFAIVIGAFVDIYLGKANIPSAPYFGGIYSFNEQ